MGLVHVRSKTSSATSRSRVSFDSCMYPSCVLSTRFRSTACGKALFGVYLFQLSVPRSLFIICITLITSHLFYPLFPFHDFFPGLPASSVCPAFLAALLCAASFAWRGLFALSYRPLYFRSSLSSAPLSNFFLPDTAARIGEDRRAYLALGLEVMIDPAESLVMKADLSTLLASAPATPRPSTVFRNPLPPCNQ